MRAASLTPPIFKVRSLTLLWDHKTISSETPNLRPKDRNILSASEK